MVKKAAQATPNPLLRTARKERGWTQKEVADRIGAPQSFNISRWEQGTALPSAHYIQQLCLLFGQSAKELGLLLEEPTENREPSTGADPSPLWTVPFRRNPFFTGREEVLQQLHDRLTAARIAALTQTQAITGLGGIGKTQIAVEFAYRYRDEYHWILWIRAATHDSLISDFVTLASLLHLPEQNEQNQNMMVAAVKRWLAHHQEWLLILDNADDIDLAADFLPTGNNGHILLTTRAQAMGSIAPSMAIEKMEKDEGKLLLLRRAKHLAINALLEQGNEDERALAQSIVEALDGLPLALDQAGAYIEETGCSLVDYLELYQTHHKELLQRRSALHTDHPEPVASTWALSFHKVEQANPAAADLLRLCAFLEPDAIPEEILTTGAPYLGPVLGPCSADAFKLHGMIEALRKFSLVRRNPNTKTLTVHRLVQAVLKDGMDEQARQQWAERAVRAVAAIFPEGTFANWQRCQEYLPQAQVGAELIEQHHFTFTEAARLLMRVGSHLRERGLVAQAEPLFDHALAVFEQVPGPEHPDTASALTVLARLYRDQGRYAQAEPLYQRALHIWEQALGPEHPEIVATLSSLAVLYSHQGRYVQAEPLYQRALHIREQTLGPEHPLTAIDLQNLASLYQFQGRYAQAEPLYQRALAIMEQALGPEHPYSAVILNSLASLYQLQGRYAQAEPLFQRALAIWEQALGPEHPETAKTLSSLALLRQNQGRYAQAEPLYQRALGILEQALGPTHPDTAQSLNHLAGLYFLQDKYEQAEPLYQRALHIREQALGPEHPDVAETLHGLASFRHAQRKHAEAASLYQRALAIREKALGLEHPDTIAVRASSSDLLQQMNHTAEAAK